MSRQRLGVAVPAGAAAVVLVLSSWFTLTSAGARLQTLSCWFAVAVFASMMSYFAFRASRRMHATDMRRRFWTAFGVAGVTFALGEWAQLATAIAAPLSMGALTGTGLARTIALGAGCMVLIVVVLTYPIPHRSPRDRVCYLLDLATVVVAAGTYGLYWTVVTTTGNNRTLLADDLVAVTAIPIVAMLTAFSVGRLYLSRVAPFTWAIGILGPIAAVVEALSRVLGPQLVLTGRPGVIFTMTVGSHSLLMIAAWAQNRSAGSAREQRRARRRLPFSLLPYVALWTTFALLVFTLAVKASGLRLWVAVAGLGVITGVVVVRQLTSFIANNELLLERDALAARLHTMAFTDSLTGLANRAQFLERLDEALCRGDGEVGVLLIDLDDFKPVNDTYGHAAGDTVLIGAAARLRAGARTADVIARLGGDEFAVLIEQARPDDVAEVADRIVEALGEPCELSAGELVRVRASIGVAITSTENRDATVLLHRADEAMYAAKSAGKGSFRLAQLA
ncbi:GGDEF domain-containing protein [Actinoplanes sp. NPDC023801]|uniref:GGDEF domain-containing protein n=1 Tax=Actinoplanes sp. NPDC023801 TaxID=3154595 RepID=UPI00340EC48D